MDGLFSIVVINEWMLNWFFPKTQKFGIGAVENKENANSKISIFSKS